MQISIIQTDYTPDAGSIITVHWQAYKTDGEYTAPSGETIVASGYGADSFQPDPDSPDFIPFDQLTEVDVVGWLMEKDGWAEALEARLDADIERQKNPPVLHGLPWANKEDGLLTESD